MEWILSKDGYSKRVVFNEEELKEQVEYKESINRLIYEIKRCIVLGIERIDMLPKLLEWNLKQDKPLPEFSVKCALSSMSPEWWKVGNKDSQLKEIQIKEAKRLRDEGKSLRDIGTTLKVSHTTIQRYLSQ